ncbi:hypothetical protein KKH13_00455, partial [Patescibacteria group bacterium]|nr:hypothetical protein [Patescibacteria group bacterium]
RAYNFILITFSRRSNFLSTKTLKRSCGNELTTHLRGNHHYFYVIYSNPALTPELVRNCLGIKSVKLLNCQRQNIQFPRRQASSSPKYWH